jgi:hypothetical protein
MRHGNPIPVLVPAMVCAGALALAQAPAKPAAKSAAPRAAHGQVEIQGVWLNATITPFERPVALGNKAYLTEQEAAAAEAIAAKNRVDRAPADGGPGSYNQFWFDAGTKVVSTRQTSLVVDPPDGRVPVKSSAEAKRDYDLAHVSDSYEHMSVWDRCITRGVPGGMFPAGYNNAYQIVQTPGYVTILYEMIHHARVIPLDGRPRLAAQIRQWDGDSRGRWEGDTLVVETTNYNGKGWIASSAATGRIKGIPQSEALRVVERFHRENENTILYDVTVDDPNVYTRPWRVAIPLTRDPEYRIYEYACHEGNLAVENILKGGRLQDRAAAQAGAR